jgi:hypothetical protein
VGIVAMVETQTGAWRRGGGAETVAIGRRLVYADRRLATGIRRECQARRESLAHPLDPGHGAP